MQNSKPEPLRSYPVTGLRGDVSVPGDKSISHRVLMLSSQVLGKTKITGLLEGEDVLNTAKALVHLGVNIQRVSEGNWEVQGVGPGGLHEPDAVLDLGNSGTSTRLLMGLVTPYPFTTFFTGDSSLRSRPMKRVMAPLEQMGAGFSARGGDKLPLALNGTQNALPIEYRLPVASAQVKSAILLAGLNTRGRTTVTEPQATRDHTENMLEYFGFKLTRTTLDDGALSVSIEGHQNPPSQAREIDIPADPSSAAFLIVAALITKDSDVTISNVCVNPLRTGLFDTLKEMGAQLEMTNQRRLGGEAIADIRVKTSRLRGVNVPASRAPSMIDEYPILAVAAAFAEGETVMEGLSELRVKESDRLSAIESGLIACGVKARAEGDSLRVTGLPAPERGQNSASKSNDGFAQAGAQPRGGAMIPTQLDHRIAMSFLVMGMGTKESVEIDDAAAIATSFPGFTSLCNRLGARIETPSPFGSYGKPLIIAIDGPAASGKGTLARRLAAAFDLAYLDTGSLYRAVGLKLEYAGEDANDVAAAVRAANSIDAEDLANPRLRQEHVGKAASIVSAMPEVRAALLDFQRRYGRSGKGAVLDGRDIGTVVFPDADFKFYLTASLEARARRRHRELSGQGIEVVYKSVHADLRERDDRDSQRDIAPLKPADDAVVIDTSTMDANSVFEKIRHAVSRKLQPVEPAKKSAVRKKA